MEVEQEAIRNVQFIITAIAIIGAISLPYISIQLWRTTDKVAFSLFCALFGMICAFVTFVGGGALLGLL